VNKASWFCELTWRMECAWTQNSVWERDVFISLWILFWIIGCYICSFPHACLSSKSYTCDTCRGYVELGSFKLLADLQSTEVQEPKVMGWLIWINVKARNIPPAGPFCYVSRKVYMIPISYSKLWRQNDIVAFIVVAIQWLWYRRVYHSVSRQRVRKHVPITRQQNFNNSTEGSEFESL
jgi:hypothetical protein